MRIDDNYVLFWHGEFSNWYGCDFTYKGVKFTSSEQAMMWEKANLFGDTEVANAIMRTNNPKEQKALGRKVRGFDVSVWEDNAVRLVTDICYEKFTQNKHLLTCILSYPGKTFVEASPLDKVWGIGLHYDDALASDKTQWNGTNWLGVCLNNVRDRIIDNGLGT